MHQRARRVLVVTATQVGSAAVLGFALTLIFKSVW